MYFYIFAWYLFAVIAGYPSAPPVQDDKDSDEDEAADHAKPSAPPIEKMDTIPGYGEIGFIPGIAHLISLMQRWRILKLNW